jgi:hypothetical protein
LDLHSTAVVNKNDPPLPPSTTSESKQQREEWMLLDPSEPVIPQPTPPLHSLTHSDSLTEGYGENTASGRTLSGGVDFFSSLGTEHRKRETKDRHNPETVRHHFISIFLRAQCVPRFQGSALVN